MPSPLPGMDPYLEDPSLWPDLHQRLITYIAEALQPQVRPKYIARIGERIELAELHRGYIPDTHDRPAATESGRDHGTGRCVGCG